MGRATETDRRDTATDTAREEASHVKDNARQEEDRVTEEAKREGRHLVGEARQRLEEPRWSLAGIRLQQVSEVELTHKEPRGSHER